METLGICIGASTLSSVVLERRDGGAPVVLHASALPHNGDPRKAVLETLERPEARRYDRIAVTGRSFRDCLNLTTLSEPESVEEAFVHLYGRGSGFNAVVSAGGETFLAYVLDGEGRISSVQTGNKCASGTGEFFLQQIRRMGMPLEEALRSARTEMPYRVSGRCSVFCKSDCTHATNKGIPKGRVAAGLSRMMAEKILELLTHVPRSRILLIGGCARNAVMVDSLKKEIDALVVPAEAAFFEALGCALWALDHETLPLPDRRGLFHPGKGLFPRLAPLKRFEDRVVFKTAPRGTAAKGDRFILGLDVGSTTTKAALVRTGDDAVCASVYIRTGGDPVRASRNCYGALLETLGNLSKEISIEGLGVTGSGRQIAGLHGMTDGIINEIIAHATGALHFDPAVDTIFEIGGQDAKYTRLTGGVPSDYAMNEACSAGTGSFLEEAARESLSIGTEEIAGFALQGETPPNFNDQCAAFISSDIKKAFQDGIGREDVVAGLVYSICMNYDHRVKGNRPVGEKVFMQGGVCYNRAVPLAMAALTGRRIVVPPDPGLIGAFGVALEVRRRMELGLMAPGRFSLEMLRDRELEYGKPFICDGGREKCDRKCEIARIRIEGRIYPFGGACNRWYNLRSGTDVHAADINLAARFEKRVFAGAVVPAEPGRRPSVGINKSFMVNTYFPLYDRFFRNLGFDVVLPGEPDLEGMKRRNAPFCYPAEIAHGYFQNLLEKNPDYLFLPLFQGDYLPGGTGRSSTCPICQGEPFYLAAAFQDHRVWRDRKASGRVLNPNLNFSGGIENGGKSLLDLSGTLGVPRRKIRAAFREAAAVQEQVLRETREDAAAFLSRLEKDPDAFAVVLFGRTYNAFVSEAHKGIPGKFASRNIPVIPCNGIAFEGEDPMDGRMYWSAGKRILGAARFVAAHPRLFGCYITNFSCGPDSFLIGYFRNIMGRKPSLTLELDSHVADAGIETRVEAFLDIVRRYREIEEGSRPVRRAARSVPARIRFDSQGPVYVDSRNGELSLRDPRVHLIFPSMGRFLSEAGSAVYRGAGIRASTLPPADEETLRMGMAHATCKECLPLLITAGSLLRCVRERGDGDDRLLYFMPTASGPCRFGQYSVYMNDLIARSGIENVALFTANGETSYGEVKGKDLTTRLWTGVILADIFEEMRSVLLAGAADGEAALAVFERQWAGVVKLLEDGGTLREQMGPLEAVAGELGGIALKQPLDRMPRILLTGEIFVRHDGLSRQYLVEEMARKGFATRVSSLAEWVYYTDWCVRNGLSFHDASWRERFSLFFRSFVMRRIEGDIRKVMSRSGLCSGRTEDVDHLIRSARPMISRKLTGEAILTVGAAVGEVPRPCCGAIAIGPFGCMPNRLAESILNMEMTRNGTPHDGGAAPSGRRRSLPFLAIECDGNPFPQMIEAKIEAFLLQAARLHGETS
ncbi:MAG TPA: acyl-CoA dehydratase activase [Syntrophales bacterium]|nr:acyl-CoA dehydratase activase [Syntrophales bacterium]